MLAFVPLPCGWRWTELDDLDAEWESIVAEAERDVTFFAAHNAFEYVGQRYGVTIQPLVSNLAADDDVRPADMRRAQETIADNDIRYIGAAVFEPRRPARQLVEAYYPVTPYADTTESYQYEATAGGTIVLVAVAIYIVAVLIGKAQSHRNTAPETDPSIEQRLSE